MLKQIKKYVKPNNNIQFIFSALVIYLLFIFPLIAKFFDGNGLILLASYYIIPTLYLTSIFIILFFYHKDLIKIKIPFLIFLSFVTILFLIGLLYENYLVDILTSLIFFLAPILAYFLSKSLVTNKNDLRWLLKNYLFLQLVQILFFLILKLVNTFILGKPFQVYKAFNIDGLYSSFLIATFVVFSYKNLSGKYGTLFKILTFLVILNEILFPISLPFKQLFLFLIIWLIFIAFNTLKKKLILFILIPTIVLLFYYYYEELYVIIRFIEHYAEIIETSIYIDKRVLEIAGVLSTIFNSPLNFAFGNGLGGMWDSNLLDVNSVFFGSVDFRTEDKVYMVHSSYFAILMRGGIIALSIYIIFLYNIYKELKKKIKIVGHNTLLESYLRSFKFFFILMIFAGFIDWYIYSNFLFGYICFLSVNQKYNEI